MVGIGAGGKTSLLYRFVYNRFMTVNPTVTFNVEDTTLLLVPGQVTKFTILDLSGMSGYRFLWHRATEGVVGVICVVDSTNESLIRETTTSLWRMFEDYDTDMKESVLLVFANKQDCVGAISVAEVRDLLELETRSEGRRWHIQGSSVTTGHGLMEGMTWMATQLQSRL
jgi:small GTP-binding protein